MKVALAQINTTVGDIPGNEAKILAAYRRGVAAGADLVCVPELAIAGYPPRDLLLKHGFVSRNLEALERLAAATGPVALVVGYVGKNEKRPGRETTNAVALLQNGKIAAARTKTLLPTYDVFDEDRYFEPATENKPAAFQYDRIVKQAAARTPQRNPAKQLATVPSLPGEGRGEGEDALADPADTSLSLGLTICEDAWNDEDFWRDRRYRRNPIIELAHAGAKVIINISASPWNLGKNRVRREMLANLAAKSACPLLYCNLVGGNDELVFDGASLVFNARGELLTEGKMFDEDFLLVDLDEAKPIQHEAKLDEEKIYKALVLGLRDYVHKCGFKSALLGLSGGIDSALTAVIAAEALGRENVRGVSLPSQFSSQGSLDDARILAQHLGIQYDVVPIQPMFLAAKEQLRLIFTGRPEDTTEENLQARLRGVVLMGMSNKFGSLLLTTGNKSELAVGYCTLYGDMCGGLAVISDVPKTMVYRIARWINRDREIIPAASITKAPSAELRPNQTDQDSLPPYEILDAILEAYVVEGRSTEEVIGAGFDPETVRRVIRLIDINEYKRRQAAPGLKVTTKAFGVGRRVPIAQKYRDS